MQDIVTSLSNMYLINFLDDGCQCLEEEGEVKQPLVHGVNGREEQLLAALNHLTEHELEVLWLHEDLAWLWGSVSDHRERVLSPDFFKVVFSKLKKSCSHNIGEY